MIVTEIYKGQGLGNQLWCYVTTRVIAKDNDYEFGIKSPENFKCNDFLNLDFGKPVVGGNGPEGGPPNTLPDGIIHYYKERKIVHPTSGADISNYDNDLVNVPDDTKIDGTMQDEQYILHRKDEVRKWLRVKKEYECYNFSSDDICVINFRGGEYVYVKDLFLPQKYWEDAVSHMLKINNNFRFVVVTDDVTTAKKFFPKFDVFHFSVAKDYVVINNARYLILANTSFAWFPAWLNENLKFCIAPKYWWGHNKSDGYWACGYNVTSGWHYQDRSGLLHNYDSCLKELHEYKEKHKEYFLPKEHDNMSVVLNYVGPKEVSQYHPEDLRPPMQKKTIINFLKKYLPLPIQRLLWKVVHVRKFLPFRVPINPKTPKEERRIFDLLKDNFQIVFDVGARDELSFYVMKPNCSFHLFEPNLKFVNALKRQIAKLKATNVTVNQYGLSDHNEDNCVYYKKSQSFIVNPVYKDVDVDTGLRYSVRTLDDYVVQNNIPKIDFLKIDAEGSDYQIILGGINIIKGNMVSYIQFEFGSWGGIKKIIDFLDNFDLFLMMEPVLFKAIKKQIVPIMNFEERLIDFRKPIIPLTRVLIDLIDHKIIPTGNGGNILGVNTSVSKHGLDKILSMVSK